MVLLSVRVGSGSTCSWAVKATGRVVGEAYPNACSNAKS
jgi:hypothetical protein